MAKPVSNPRPRTSRMPTASANGTGRDRAIKELTYVFKSLADRHRLKIIFLLVQNGEMSVSAISEELKQSQPAVSHHLMQLRTAGLLDFRRDGKFNYYHVNPEGLAELFDFLFPGGTPSKLTVGGIEISFKRKG